MKRNICSYILFLLLLLYATTGCAGTSEGSSKDSAENENTAENIQSDYVYVPTFSQYDIRVSAIENGGDVRDAFITGGKLYTIVIHYPENKSGSTMNVIMTDTATGEQTEKEIDNLSFFYDTMNGFAAYDHLAQIFYFYDRDFELTGELDIRSVVRDAENNGVAFSPNDVVVDNEGNIGIAGGDVILLFDSSHNLLRTVSKPNYIKEFKELMVTREGKWYVYCYAASGEGTLFVTDSIYQLDMEHGKVGEIIDTPNEKRFQSKVNCIASGGFYYGGNSCIYRYNEENDAIEEVFRMTDYGISLSEMRSTACMGDEDIIYIANELDDRDTVVEYEVAAIEKRLASEVKERTEIVIGGCYRFVSTPILQFNKYNTEYYCTLKNYYATDDGEDVDAEVARQNFYNDLIEGRGADVFLFTFNDRGRIDIRSLGEKGVLADLYEFMNNDEELNREDFIPNVLEQMEYEDGKLYAVYDSFNLYSFAGKTSVFGECDEWNYVTLLEIMREYPDALLQIDLSQEDMMQIFLLYSMGTFYDIDTGECSFDSDEFKAMLEILALIPKEPDRELWYSRPELMDTEKVLLYCVEGINWGINIRKADLYYGDNDITYLGVPSSNGMAGFAFYDCVAINAQSENKEGAWELVKSFFEEKSQDNGMPSVIREYFDAAMEEELARNLSGIDDGYVRFKTNTNITEEDVRTINTLIDNAVSWRDYDADIYTIIDEEAQGYFAGVKSLDDTAATIQNRVQLYIDEKR
ncbi:MAG: hypothetical protein ACI4R6_02725 [Lachnospiraceae bacterium]